MSRVTVILPLFNKAKYIARAIDSILNQSFSDFELIIVDDGSTDGSSEIAARYQDAKVKIISQPNAGPGAARNSGLRQAQGELIAFLDGDDEWHPNYLEESVALLDMSSPETASVTSGYVEYPRGKSRTAMWLKRGIRNREFLLSAYMSPLTVVYFLAYMSSWSTLTKRSVLERWGGFYSDDHCTYAEDSFLWLKILLNERVRFSLTPRVNYHREASSLSQSLVAPHPVEPFLLFPEKIRESCPLELRSLLEQVLAIRALKTACVLGFWGKWQEARHLMHKFPTNQVWRTPHYTPALICSTPFGAAFGRMYQSKTDFADFLTSLRLGRIFNNALVFIVWLNFWRN